MSTYDAVVVGSGHNALITAAYLARAGWSDSRYGFCEELKGSVR